MAKSSTSFPGERSNARLKSFWGSGWFPAALLQCYQERFQARRHAWTLAKSSPGPAAGTGNPPRGPWTGGDGLPARTRLQITRRASYCSHLHLSSIG
eukprot:1381627-Pyramimonas_sp.AAC.1